MLRLTALIVLAQTSVCISAVAAAPSCAADTVANQIEDDFISEGRNILAFAEAHLKEAGERNRPFDLAEVKILTGNYDITLSDTYKVAEKSNIISCKGTLKLTLPHGESNSFDIDYEVIQMDDGKTKVLWNVELATSLIVQGIVPSLDMDR